MKSTEINFDGIVGPTHNYGGLAFGNFASEKNSKRLSNPKAAALQGLKKMYLLMQLGVPQAVLPPHERPALSFLKNLGFIGSNAKILKTVYHTNPGLFAACCSASSMWVANAATVTPSADSLDRRVHITPANLMSNFHRALEAQMNFNILKNIFSDKKYFNVHAPLCSYLNFADEGAANHIRFCKSYDNKGLNLFIYDRDIEKKNEELPYRNPARQTKQASEAISRLHQLDTDSTFFLKQNPVAIEQGVFHNDVISVANQNVFLYHKLGFTETGNIMDAVKHKFESHLYLLPVTDTELSLHEAVKSYIFNSQLVTLQSGLMALIAPIESQQNNHAYHVLLRLQSEQNPISELYFVDCGQSMLNGGGPACLRLRVVLTEAERFACPGKVFLDEDLYGRLLNWVVRHYRDRLSLSDLVDPNFLEEIYMALDELTQILELGSIYNFQKI